MRRITMLTITMLALSSFIAGTVRADSPHFIRASASGPDADGDLLVSFKISGLGTNVTLTVTASAQATATYACQNRGDNCPDAKNKQDVSGPVSASGSFTSGKNGTISNNLTLNPPPTTLDCPGGHKLVLVHVSYTDVQISAPGVPTETIVGTFSRTFVSGDCAALFGL
jgi:hypothetical protein